MKNKPMRIMIVRLSALGDIINTAVVLQFVKAKFPHAEIEWVTEEIFAPVLQNHPLLDKVHTINLKQLKKEKSFSSLFATVKKLKHLGEFDLIIDVQGLLKSAIVARIIGKNTYGFDKNSSREPLSNLFYSHTSAIDYEENVVKRNTFLVADSLGIEISDTMLLSKKAVFEHLNTNNTIIPNNDQNKKNIALVIGASWESKKYPKELFAKLCNELKQNCIVLWGSEKEKSDAEWICEHSKYAMLAPQMNLKELINFVSACDLLIGNDTGPTHMAWAQNIPSITLFGPTTSRMIYETPKNIGIKSPSEVNINKINKNDFSIKEIPVATILQKAKELIE